MAQHINEILVRIYEHGVVDEHAEPHYYNEKPNDFDPLMLGEAKQKILTDLLEMAEPYDKDMEWSESKQRFVNPIERAVPVDKLREYFQGGEE